MAIQRPDEVRTIQETLNSLGYDTGTVDGLWGNNTSEGFNHFVRDIQRHAFPDQDSEQDGFYGENTHGALAEQIAAMYGDRLSTEEQQNLLSALEEMIIPVDANGNPDPNGTALINRVHRPAELDEFESHITPVTVLPDITVEPEPAPEAEPEPEIEAQPEAEPDTVVDTAPEAEPEPLTNPVIENPVLVQPSYARPDDMSDEDVVAQAAGLTEMAIGGFSNGFGTTTEEAQAQVAAYQQLNTAVSSGDQRAIIEAAADISGQLDETLTARQLSIIEGTGGMENYVRSVFPETTAGADGVLDTLRAPGVLHYFNSEVMVGLSGAWGTANFREAMSEIRGIEGDRLAAERIQTVMQAELETLDAAPAVEQPAAEEPVADEPAAETVIVPPEPVAELPEAEQPAADVQPVVDVQPEAVPEPEPEPEPEIETPAADTRLNLADIPAVPATFMGRPIDDADVVSNLQTMSMAQADMLGENMGFNFSYMDTQRAAWDGLGNLGDADAATVAAAANEHLGAMANVLGAQELAMLQGNPNLVSYISETFAGVDNTPEAALQALQQPGVIAYLVDQHMVGGEAFGTAAERDILQQMRPIETQRAGIAHMQGIAAEQLATPEGPAADADAVADTDGPSLQEQLLDRMTEIEAAQMSLMETNWLLDDNPHSPGHAESRVMNLRNPERFETIRAHLAENGSPDDVQALDNFQTLEAERLALSEDYETLAAGGMLEAEEVADYRAAFNGAAADPAADQPVTPAVEQQRVAGMGLGQ